MRVYFLTIVFLIANIGNAQKTDCSKQIKEYQELLLVKNYADALAPWEFVVKNCPKQSAEIYTDGIQIHEYRIDNAVSQEEKEKYVRDLIKIYDKFYANFREEAQDFEIKKAMLLVSNSIDSKDEIFTLFENGFAKAADKVNKAFTIFNYFKIYNETYISGNKKITTDQYIEKYIQLNQLLNNLKISNPDKTDEYNSALKSILATGRSVVNCDNLSSYFEKNSANNVENQQWNENALELLKSKCSSKPVFYKLAEINYNLNKTAKSSEYLAFASLKNRKFDDARKYYDEAATLETNPIEKAQLYYTIATTLYNNNLVKVKEYLNKALVLNPKLTKAYIQLSQAYINSAERCGKTDFDKKAIHYLAIQTANKAVLHDPESARTIESIVAKYTVKSLTNDEISKGKWFGKSYKIECDINETIQFPSKK